MISTSNVPEGEDWTAEPTVQEEGPPIGTLLDDSDVPINLLLETLQNKNDSTKHKMKENELQKKYRCHHPDLNGLTKEVSDYLKAHDNIKGATINEKTCGVWFHISITQVYNHSSHPDGMRKWQWHRLITKG